MRMDETLRCRKCRKEAFSGWLFCPWCGITVPTNGPSVPHNTPNADAELDDDIEDVEFIDDVAAAVFAFTQCMPELAYERAEEFVRYAMRRRQQR